MCREQRSLRCKTVIKVRRLSGGTLQMREDCIMCIWPKTKKGQKKNLHRQMSGWCPYFVFIDIHNRFCFFSPPNFSKYWIFLLLTFSSVSIHPFIPLFSHTLHIAPAPAWEPTLPQLSHRQGLNFRIGPNLCRRLDGVTARYQGQGIPLSSCISATWNRVKLHLQNTCQSQTWCVLLV